MCPPQSGEVCPPPPALSRFISLRLPPSNDCRVRLLRPCLAPFPFICLPASIAVSALFPVTSFYLSPSIGCYVRLLVSTSVLKLGGCMASSYVVLCQCLATALLGLLAPWLLFRGRFPGGLAGDSFAWVQAQVPSTLAFLCAPVLAFEGPSQLHAVTIDPFPNFGPTRKTLSKNWQKDHQQGFGLEAQVLKTSSIQAPPAAAGWQKLLQVGKTSTMEEVTGESKSPLVPSRSSPSLALLVGFRCFYVRNHRELRSGGTEKTKKAWYTFSKPLEEPVTPEDLEPQSSDP